MSNPLDDYVAMRKQAGLWDAFTGGATKGVGELGKQLVTGAGLAAGGALLAGGALAVGKIRESIARKNDFKQMMSVDPELKDLQAERPAFFNQAYNSLRRINPSFGGDPIVAGSYMRKMMANPDAAGLTLAQSVKPPQLGGSSAQFQAELGPFKVGM